MLLMVTQASKHRHRYATFVFAFCLYFLPTACEVYDSNKLNALSHNDPFHDGSVEQVTNDTTIIESAYLDSSAEVEGSEPSVDSSPFVDGSSSVDSGEDQPPSPDCAPNDDPNCPWICPEVCDDEDNNCNNEIDEGNLWVDKGESCGVGIGECQATGRYVCDDTDPKGDLVCDAEPKEATTEVCDGRDNNCDGETDESFPDVDEDGIADCINDDDDNDNVINALDNCPRQSNTDQMDSDGDGAGDVCDTDDDDDSDPDTSDCEPLDPAIHHGAAEICDGIDNDCDVDIDEALYCGPPFSYDPSNFQPDDLDPAAAPEDITLSCDAVFDSSGTPSFTEWCGQPTPVVVLNTAVEPNTVILTFRDFRLADTGSLSITGDRPVIFAVFGDADINGHLNASANLATPGPGGNLSCTVGIGGDGPSSNSNDDGAGAGGGGAFGDNGGVGGWGQWVGGGSNGAVEGNPEIIPLRGGCPGGRGGRGTGSTGRYGGGGGGAIQISTVGDLSITNIISVAGGGGQEGSGRCDGGGGGGSGGAVLLEGRSVSVAADAWITANGGGGAEGTSEGSNTSGTNGQNGYPASAANAPGGSGGGAGGDGGNGGSLGDTAGDNGSRGNDGGDNGGGGGGGGGVGRVRINAVNDCPVEGSISATFSNNGCG